MTGGGAARRRGGAGAACIDEVLAQAQRVEAEVNFEQLVDHKQRGQPLPLVAGALLRGAEALHEVLAGVVQPLRLLPCLAQLAVRALRHLRRAEPQRSPLSSSLVRGVRVMVRGGRAPENRT